MRNLKGRTTVFVGLAVILKDECPLIDQFIIENEIFTLFDKAIFVDDFSTDGSYETLLQYFASGRNGKHREDAIYRRSLNFNFSEQRNYAASFLNTDYICRIDLDEIMNNAAKEFLSERVFETDFYQIHREEIIDGELREVSEQPFLYRNDKDIKWVRTVHEWLEGYNTLELLPDDCRLLHWKTSERCTKQNQFYHNNFLEHRQLTGVE